jgi:hypothetical protein
MSDPVRARPDRTMIGALAFAAFVSVIAVPALAARHLPGLAEAPRTILRCADATVYVFETVRAGGAEPLLSAGLL